MVQVTKLQNSSNLSHSLKPHIFLYTSGIGNVKVTFMALELSSRTNKEL